MNASITQPRTIQRTYLVLILILVLQSMTDTTLFAQTSAFKVDDASNVNLLNLNTDAGFLVKGSSGAGTIPASGAGTRFMWYPKKAAVRAGLCTGAYWDDGNIGDYSIAMGYNTKATDQGATALGYSSIASKPGATALGWVSNASGDYSTAAGKSSTASGTASTAMGNLSTASGLSSTAIGDQTAAAGDYSTAMGYMSSTTAAGDYGTAIGHTTVASGIASTALGNATGASGNSSTAMGKSTVASGDYSTAMGLSTTASGIHSTALGYNTTASGENSTAMGFNTAASGVNSTAMGAYSTASGTGSIAEGFSTTANGDYTVAIGSYVNTYGWTGSCIIGDQSTANVTYSNAYHQMTMRFHGGYRLYSKSDLSTCVYMKTGVSGWLNYCDRNMKENFRALDGEELLRKIKDLPITEWNYKNTDPSVRYVGPMAQDFWQAFKLGGTDSLGINSIAIDGVNMAAIQALEKRTADLKNALSEIEQLKSIVKNLALTNSNMQSRLAKLEAESEKKTSDNLLTHAQSTIHQK